MHRPRIAIFISGTGTNMAELLKACKSGFLKADPIFVASDRDSAKGLTTARNLGVESLLFSYKDLGRTEAEKCIAETLEDRNIEWIILAGYMRILSPEFVRRFKGRIINIHPALLPAFPGAHAIEDAWNAGVKTTGVTVHIVDEEVDHGPILAQQEVQRVTSDTIYTLEERIHNVEHTLYKNTLKTFFEKECNK